MIGTGSGTKDDPWVLKTPPGTSEYQMYLDDSADPPELVCQATPKSGSAMMRYSHAVMMAATELSDRRVRRGAGGGVAR